MTGEQRYRQAMKKAELVWKRNVSEFVKGKRGDSGESLYDLQRHYLIKELERHSR